MNEKIFRTAVILSLRFLVRERNPVTKGMGGEWHCKSCGARSSRADNTDHIPGCEWKEAMKSLELV